MNNISIKMLMEDICIYIGMSSKIFIRRYHILWLIYTPF